MKVTLMEGKQLLPVKVESVVGMNQAEGREVRQSDLLQC